jgi:uncharacterized protein (TIGR02145 family)
MNRVKYLLVLIVSGTLITLTESCTKPSANAIERGTVTDFEGNVYNTVKIGNQWWMSDNLMATKYNNGDQIGTTVPNSLSITDATAPKYHWSYSGDESFAAIYGRLYTWYAVTDTRNVCPAGWHVPSDIDWNILSDYVNSGPFGAITSTNSNAKILASQTGWVLDGIVGNPGQDMASNNKSGFSAMPGGLRQPSGTYSGAGLSAYYWSTTADIPLLASTRLVYFNLGTLQESNYTRDSGISVRCVKD